MGDHDVDVAGVGRARERPDDVRCVGSGPRLIRDGHLQRRVLVEAVGRGIRAPDVG
jgi:hypothetical protein